MQSDTALTGLAHSIQLAVAPVFLLSGVGAFLGVLTNRLARVIDRSRQLDAMPPAGDAVLAERTAIESEVLRQRIRLVNSAITFCTYSALLVAGVVGALFVGAVARFDLTELVAATFVLAMVALITGLSCFLREIHVATRHYREAHGLRPPRRRPVPQA